MSAINVTKNNYTVEPLHQWDVNQQLQIYGLSLASVPEVHFSNQAMDRAIVRQATMDKAGVITVDVPNALLQKYYTISVYLCTYDGGTFQTLYKVDVPVMERPQPSDYSIKDDQDIYSFKALENQVANVLYRFDEIDKKYNDSVANYNAAVVAYNNAEKDYEKIKAAEEIIRTTYTKDEILTDATKTLFGLDASATPDDVFAYIFNNKTKIKCGSYVGTGVGGAANPSSLTFDFVPQFVVIFQTSSPSPLKNGSADLTLFNGVFTSLGLYFGASGYNWGNVNVEWEDTTVKWWATGTNADVQQNEASETYLYIAIG